MTSAPSTQTDNIAIITARSGSKRIPKKNIKDFLGKPIIAYVIDAALQSGVFANVMVSTDSQEIADIAASHGGWTPFLRSEKNSDDFATTADVISEVLEHPSVAEHSFQRFCCLYPTAVLIYPELLSQSFEAFVASGADSLMPVVRFPHPIERALRLDGQRVSYAYPEHQKSRTQDLEPKYFDPGMFYWGKTKDVLETKKLIGPNTGFHIMDEKYTQDIDEPGDWGMAEMKFQMLFARHRGSPRTDDGAI